MDLAIVQRMVCPAEHASTPLVVRADRAEHGRLQEGVVGCPVCGAEWKVDEGVARFGPRATTGPAFTPDATTVAALLGLTEPKLVVADGLSDDLVVSLVREFGATVVAIDSDVSPESASVIEGPALVPLAEGIANGAVLLRPREPAFVDSVVRAIAPDGRLLASVSLQLPAGVREMARNDDLWLAEREATVVPVTLRRR
jgi:hypothetical protein